ncbi:MAG: hypothetical protein J7M34_07645 [Anaerolineae bacterium]|nr:hypothetical protein [Anaerolineae bacterium]
MDPQTGRIPNNLPGGVPFSKNNMSPYYEEAKQRLLDPGGRWGRPGAWPWIAQPIHGGHTWQINVKDYPELEDVVPVLFGVSLEEMNRLVGRMRLPEFGGGNGQSTTLPYRSGTATAG